MDLSLKMQDLLVMLMKHLKILTKVILELIAIAHQISTHLDLLFKR